MGNKLYVDNQVTELSDILNFPIENLKEDPKLPTESSNYQNLKVWKFYEDSDDKVKNSPLEITKIAEEHFLFSSYEAYIILLVSYGLDKGEEQEIFPKSLWGIVESSSNMTPRGLKYVFSSSEENEGENCENLESFMVSNRCFKNSSFNYVIFIWNGKNTHPMVKSTVMMHAFDLDKKLTKTNLLSCLYFGNYIEHGEAKFEPGKVVCLNNYVNNTIESPTKKPKKPDNVPNSEEFRDFSETVYLLQWLYPGGNNMNTEQQVVSKKKTLYPKFTETFLKPVNCDYYSCFTPIDANGKKVQVEDTDDTDNENIDLDDIDLRAHQTPDKKTNNFFQLDMKKSNLKMSMNVPNLHMEIKPHRVNDEVLSKRSNEYIEGEKISPANSPIKKNNNTKGFKIKVMDLNNNDQMQKIDLTNLRDAEDKDDRKLEKEKNAYYTEMISEILPELLYVSSYLVAKNLDILKENKITHIINVAADVCENHYPDKITYLHFYLKDHNIENIECLFYECIKFIENVKSKKGRVLIHCVQGISRSVSLVLCYLIYSLKLNYDEALSIVTSKRPIANPNIGFAIQLQYFYKRLFDTPENFRIYPKIFSIGSFQVTQPEKIVCRLMIDHFFDKMNINKKMFDRRGIFLILTTGKIYLWIGSKVSPIMKDQYMKAAKSYITVLQENEYASKIVQEEKDSEETEEFIKIWFDDYNEKPNISSINQDWNSWYKEITSQDLENEKNGVIEIITEQKYKKAFYFYPNEGEPENLIDFCDLEENTNLVACVIDEKEDLNCCYIWSGCNSSLAEKDLLNYIEKVKAKFFSEDEIESVEIKYEVPEEESEDFLQLL